MTPDGLVVDPTLLWPFDAVIDGYFPLAVSIAHLLDRLKAKTAMVQLAHAPVMDIPGLPHDAPVPLNIRAGRAGMVDQMTLWCSADDEVAALSGHGRWRWLDDGPTVRVFDPMTRLAEPALVRGYAASLGEGTGPQPARAFRVTRTFSQDDIRAALGVPNAELHGPFPPGAITESMWSPGGGAVLAGHYIAGC